MVPLDIWLLGCESIAGTHCQLDSGDGVFRAAGQSSARADIFGWVSSCSAYSLAIENVESGSCRRLPIAQLS